MTGNRQNSKKKPNNNIVPVKKKKKRRFIFLKLLLFILLCLVIGVTFAQRGYKYILDGTKQSSINVNDAVGTEFTIPYGSSTTDIAEMLKKQEYINDTNVFKIMSKLIGFDGLYKAGRYIIDKDMNEYALMLRLTGEPLKNPSVDIRIPEGMTVVELADYLENKGLIVKEKFIRLCEMHLTQFSFQSELDVQDSRVYPLEGYLYPDTYKLDEGWDEEKLVLRTLDEFNRIYTEEYKKRAIELDLTTDEVITLASLIEMEALNPIDLKIISSVFHNRMNSTDLTLLQSDTTIQYARVMEGLGRTTSVLYVDLEINSPYNTYIHPGLPPGPICSPRKDAIEAALYPEKTKFYYFFTAADGTNIYNETYAGHINDQTKYGVSGQ